MFDVLSGLLMGNPGARGFKLPFSKAETQLDLPAGGGQWLALDGSGIYLAKSGCTTPSTGNTRFLSKDQGSSGLGLRHRRRDMPRGKDERVRSSRSSMHKSKCTGLSLKNKQAKKTQEKKKGTLETPMQRV